MLPTLERNAKTCAIENCPKPARARGWCEGHYRRWKRHGNPTYSASDYCKVSGCESVAVEFRWCEEHLEEKKCGKADGKLFSRNPTCVTEKCQNPRYFLGRCEAHQKLIKLSSDPIPDVPQRCKFPKCRNRKSSLGYCGGHYAQVSLGKELAPLKGHGIPLDTRFFESVTKSETCWIWSGNIGTTGYGVFPNGKTSVPAHRVSYELHTGMIPNGMQIDHMCSNRTCVNPDHLRLATGKQNAEHRATLGVNSTGYRGVSWHAGQRTYRARVTHFGETFELGDFESAELAGEAVRLKRLELFTHNLLDRRAS